MGLSLTGQGRGINSIPVRCGIISFVLTGLCAGVQAYFWPQVGKSGNGWPWPELFIAMGVLVPASITYLAARRLTGFILALQRSTEAIACGDMELPVEVECASEVGGLADSFRRMVDRLNLNILRIKVLAHSDPITGLPNRSVIEHILGQALRQHGGAPRHIGVLFIDLDFLKSISDTFGHRTGDELLRLCSQRIIVEGLKRRPEEIDSCLTSFGGLCARWPKDIVFARFAADEFVAIIPDVSSIEPLHDIACAIIACLNRPFMIAENSVKVGASIGIARAPFDTTEPAELVILADFAMYAAKESGKGTFAFFSQKMRDQVLERGQIEKDLRQAIEAEALTLYFQPKVSARDFRVAGFEALLRWNHPTRGMVPPSCFIEIAERSGLMPALGRMVSAAAIRQCRIWLDKGLRVPVAINVSPSQFSDPHLVPDLLHMIADAAIDPALIDVEITESLVMEDFAATRLRIEDLRAAGLRISIDDFGVGFSNLALLSKLPVNTIKIDRSLIQGIGVDPRNEAIIRAIADMANAMKYDTIAEGIENQRQAAFLRKAGCTSLQGFLFAPPMPVEEVEGWLRARQQSGVAQLQARIPV